MLTQRTRLASVTAVALFLAAACDGNRDRASTEVEARSLVTPPAGLPDEGKVDLYAIKGLRGLIEDGDELLVMVYGSGAREASIRSENVAAGLSSLSRWQALKRKDKVPLDGALLRVPDLDDESGSRFYYFERTAAARWDFRAICTGAWDDDPAWPSECDVTYPVGRKVVSLRISEPGFLKNRDAIVRLVFDALADDGVLARTRTATRTE